MGLSNPDREALENVFLDVIQITISRFSTQPQQTTKIVTSLTCDYLVVGGGATGMAFVDELIHHSKDLTVVMVDRCL